MLLIVIDVKDWRFLIMHPNRYSHRRGWWPGTRWRRWRGSRGRWGRPGRTWCTPPAHLLASELCAFSDRYLPEASMGWKSAMVPRWGSLISVVYTMQRSERITIVQSQSTQNLKSNMRCKLKNWDGFFSDNKHLLVLRLVEHVGEPALATVLHETKSKNHNPIYGRSESDQTVVIIR